MDIRGMIEFLDRLKKNNNREWFAANKSLYDEVRALTLDLASRLINEIAAFDTDAAYLSPADCTYRIYRDVRFSSDKSPYKTHIGIFINPPRGKKDLRMGYYLHIEPRNSFLCVGNICYPPKLLASIRQSIYDNIEEYLEILGNEEFRKNFPVIGENPLKKAPKGFPADWEHIDLLKPRDFIAYHKLGLKELTSPNFISNAAKILATSKPFVDFINYTVDEFTDSSN